MQYGGGLQVWKHVVADTVVLFWFLGAVIPAGVLLIIRWLYQMLRGQEGLGLGDVKLLAMLGGWIGIKGAILSFAIALCIGLVISLLLYVVPPPSDKKAKWSLMKLPFGTFLCVGGIIAGIWGEPVLAAYARL
jgi:leader peptidase (prepilin peptidase)/N-methyltransferase